jgi:predicted transcriptional regulator
MSYTGSISPADTGRVVIWDIDRAVFACLVERADAEDRSRGDVATELIARGLNPHTVELDPDVLVTLDRLARERQSTRSHIASDLIAYALKALVLLERIKPALDQEAALAAGMTYLGARLCVADAIAQAAVAQDVSTEEQPAS